MRFFWRFLPSSEVLAIQPIRWLVLARLCANIFFSSTTIVLFQEQRGLNFTAMFAMESILAGAILLADIPTSIWADRFGYRRMIILGSLCSLVGLLCTLFAYGFWLFAVANVLGGFAIACTSGCESALLYHNLTEDMRVKHSDAAFTLLSMASTCGFFLGLLTGSFIGAFSPTLAVGTSIVPLLCSLAAAWRIREPQARHGNPVPQVQPRALQIVQTALKTIYHQPILIGLKIFSSAAFSLTNAIFWFNQPYFARAGILVALFGPAMALAMGCQLLMMLRMITFLRYLGTRLMLVLACLLPGVAYLLLTCTVQPLFTVGLIVCIITFSAWQEPLVSKQLNQYIDDASRATTLSALSLVGSLIGIALNPWIGSLGDRGLTTVGLGMGISLVLLCVLVPLVVKKSVLQH